MRNDGVKVLLVTNESELITTYEKSDDQGKTTKYYTDSAKAYKRAKEKQSAILFVLIAIMKNHTANYRLFRNIHAEIQYR